MNDLRSLLGGGVPYPEKYDMDSPRDVEITTFMVQDSGRDVISLAQSFQPAAAQFVDGVWHFAFIRRLPTAEEVAAQEANYEAQMQEWNRLQEQLSSMTAEAEYMEGTEANSFPFDPFEDDEEDA